MNTQKFVVRTIVGLLTLLSATYATAHPGSGIAVDDRGVVYFTDTGRGVWKIDLDGQLTLVSDSAMHWMAIDPLGKFATSPENFGEWFGRLTPEGETPTLVSCSDFPCAIGPDGNLYFARMHGLTIVRRTPKGDESIFVEPRDFGVDLGRPIGANGIQCGPDGAVYVVTLDSLNRSVGNGDHVLYAIDKSGRTRTVAKNFITEKLPESERHIEVRPEYCRGMAVDDDGSIYIAATGNRCVMKITHRGEASTLLKAEKPWSPTGVAAHDGEMYVLEYDDETPTEGRNWPPRVRKVNREGKVQTIAEIRRER